MIQKSQSESIGHLGKPEHVPALTLRYPALRDDRPAWLAFVNA
ncbi:Uncharacterised protein [Vibrio cholerae]|nr:Uncharacterised protein [Vibrio cholerae]CSD36478.1 Uncharacterised protein [Vibrio cholerae]CSH86691.1 Uncharacterised protein [Vibrio cholerae]